MPLKPLDRKALQDILLKNWMTHDALWYVEAAKALGMAQASPMNLNVCRTLGRIECSRLMKAVGAASPGDMDEYRQLFEFGKQVFVPEFMKFQIEYPGNDRQIFHVFECFAHRGMQKAGLIADYECGIFERIEGWLDTMGLTYRRSPDLSRCLKFKGEECRVKFRFNFGGSSYGEL